MAAAAQAQGISGGIGRILAERAASHTMQPDLLAGLEAAGQAMSQQVEARFESGGTPLPIAFRGASPFLAETATGTDWSRHVAFALDFEGIGKAGALFVELPLFYAWYETLAGGADNADLMLPERPPSELENRAGLIFCRAVCDALMAVFEASTTIGRIAMNAAPAGATAEAMADGEHLLMRHACTANAPETGIFLALPARLAESLRVAAEKPEAEKPVAEDTEWLGAMRRSVDRTPLVLDVVAGQWEVSLKALAQIRPGTIYRLGSGSSGVVVEASGKALLKTELGQASGAYMLKYLEPAEKDGGLDGEFPI